MFKTIMVVSLVAFLLGCAGAEKPVTNISCSGQNWKDLGAQTAKDLKPIRTFDAYIENCGSRLDPDAKAAFIDGYARALIDICNYKRGYELGAANHELPEICPLEVRADFQHGYAQGKREFDEKMRNLKRIMDEKEEIAKRRSPFQGRQSIGNSGQSSGVDE
jgi:hypothetical protein